jgi:hypothetical protein
MSAAIEISAPARAIDVLRSPHVVVVEPTQRSIEVTPSTSVVEVYPVRREIEIGAQGLRGQRGEQGLPGETEGATFIAIAGETIHGGRAVRCSGGLLYHPDLGQPDHADQVCGVAVQSGIAGTSLLVRTRGPFVEPTATWDAGAVWCGAGGVLEQAVPLSGWLLVVGRARNATTIDVDVEEPVIRS